MQRRASRCDFVAGGCAARMGACASLLARRRVHGCVVVVTATFVTIRQLRLPQPQNGLNNGPDGTTCKRFYVSPSGDDNGAGTASSPWHSPSLALTAAQSALTHCSVVINFEPGEYRLRAPLNLTGIGHATHTLVLQPRLDAVDISKHPAPVIFKGSVLYEGAAEYESDQPSVDATLSPFRRQRGRPHTVYRQSTDTVVIMQLDKPESAWSGSRPRHLYVNGRRAARTQMSQGGKCSDKPDNPKQVFPPGPSPCARPLSIWDADKAPSMWRWLARRGQLSEEAADGAEDSAVAQPMSRADDVVLTRAHPRAAHLNATGFLLPPGLPSTSALNFWATTHRSCPSTGVEFVFTGVGGSPWAETRCPVASVKPWQPASEQASKASGSLHSRRAYVELEKHCWERYKWKCLVQKKKGFIAPPTAIENVGYQFLHEGEWWPDSCDDRRVFYRALPEEIGRPLRVELPVLEQLVVGHAASRVRFFGISFQHSTWIAPSSSGFVEDQSGVSVRCAAWIDNGKTARNGAGFDVSSLAKSGGAVDEIIDRARSAALAVRAIGEANTRRARSTPLPTSPSVLLDCDERAPTMPAAVSLSKAHMVTFERCEFAQLGASGLAFHDGTRQSGASECRFRDISGSAFVLGSFDGGHRVTDPAQQDWGNHLVHSIIDRAATEYHGGVGIAVGYAGNTTIARNYLNNLPYAGISVGWGWGLASNGARSNRIVRNRVVDYKRMLNDGGCIYTLSPQPGTAVLGNWCDRQGTPTGGALYPDEGSSGMLWKGNLVTHEGGTNWLHVWNESIRDLVVEGNFHTSTRDKNKGINVTLRGNIAVELGSLPPQAKEIARQSGPALSSPWPEARPHRVRVTDVPRGV